MTLLQSLKKVINIFLISTIIFIPKLTLACDQGGGENDCSANSSALPGSTQQSNQPNSSVGNPINVITGNKYQQEVDYGTSGGVASLLFKRHYNSLNVATDTGMGLGWRHSYDVQLKFSANPEIVHISQSDGRRIIFRLDPNTKVYRAVSPSDGLITSSGKWPVWHLNDGRRIVFNGNFPTRIIYPGEKAFKLTYSVKGSTRKLNSITDHQGRQLKLKYSEGSTALGNFTQDSDQAAQLSGHLESVTLPDGGVINYSYDSDHNLSKVTYPDGTSRTYHYENVGFPNHLTGITDRTGKRFATWGYTDEGRASLSAHAGGAEKVTLAYQIPPKAGDIGTTFVTNSLGQQSTYTWRFYPRISQSLLISSEGPGCSTCPSPNKTYTYNNDYQLETSTDAKTGNIIRYHYDSKGRTEKVTKKVEGVSEQLVVRYEYEGNQPRPTLIARPSVNADGEHTTRIKYNDDQLPISLTEQGFSPAIDGSVDGGFEPIERTTSLSYTNGNLTTIDGPRSDVQDLIQLSYDPQNRLQSLTQANGQTLKVKAYDINGRPTRIQRGTQSPVSLSYNPQGQIKSIKQRMREVTYAYDAESRLTQITSPDGETIRMAYDEAGRLHTLNDDKGRQIQQLHDSESRPQQTQLLGTNGAVLNTISYLYDAQGRLDKTQSQTLDGETETDYQYDDKGQLVKVEKDNQAVELSYNPLGQLLGLTQPGEVVTQFSYDNKGQSNALTDARDNKTQTIKDDFGRTVQHISPDTGTNTYAYDKAGNRIQRTDPENNITRYQWNASNQLTQKDTSTPLSTGTSTETTTYSYDPQTGKLASTTNPNTTESFEYNREGQLITHTREIDDQSFTTKYEYNDQDKLHKKHLPDGQTLRYHYYAKGEFGNENNQQTGKLRAITRETLFGLKQENIIAEIDHDKTDGKSGYLSHNGIQTQYTFREDGQLQNIQIADTLKLKYSYDQNGNITGIDENGTLQQFAYDQGRLTFADTLTGTYAYDYDKVGNRTAKIHEDKQGNATVENYTYPQNGEGNRLTSLSLEGEGLGEGENKSHQYNKSGSPVNTNKFSYEYNSNQRPVKVFETVDNNKQLLAEYAYNSFGERIKKVSYSHGKKDKVTYFLYDGHTLTAEIEKPHKSGGVSFNQYIYLKHQPVAKLEQKQLYAIHSDHLGTPRLASDDSKQTVWQANYSPFGKAEVETVKISLNLRLPGQYEDAETGTHYNYLRDYDPETGRYITYDPISLKGGVNSYLYALADPLQKIDTLGLWSWPWQDDKELSPEEEGSEVIDQIKEAISSAGDGMVDALVGENFRKIGESIFGTLPQAFEDLTFEDPKYEKPSVQELQTFLSESALDLVYTMMVLAAIERGADFIINKPNPWTFIGGKLVKVILKQGVRAYILYEFGSAGVGFYDTIYSIGERIADMKDRNINNDCTLGDELYAISQELARASADFVLASGDGLSKMKRLKEKLNFKNKSCKKASTNSNYKDCYKNINGLKGLSAAQIKKLETALDVFTKVCTSKK